MSHPCPCQVDDERARRDLALAAECTFAPALAADRRPPGDERSESRPSRANALERQLQSDEAVRVPKVTVHGTAKARRDRAASAYVINGPETNVATGSGIRGIRWLQTNGNDFA